MSCICGGDEYSSSRAKKIKEIRRKEIERQAAARRAEIERERRAEIERERRAERRRAERRRAERRRAEERMQEQVINQVLMQDQLSQTEHDSNKQDKNDKTFIGEQDSIFVVNKLEEHKKRKLLYHEMQNKIQQKTNKYISDHRNKQHAPKKVSNKAEKDIGDLFAKMRNYPNNI